MHEDSCENVFAALDETHEDCTYDDVGDCMDMVSNLDSISNCSYHTVGNSCFDEQVCNATFVMYNETYECDCAYEGIACFDMIDEIYAEANKKTEEIHGPFGCQGKYNLIECSYVLIENLTTNEFTCNITYMHAGSPMTMDCQNFDAQWWQQGDECGTTCSKPVDCEDTLFTWCRQTECHDTCHRELKCYAEWTDQFGDYRASTCDHFDEKNHCRFTGEDQYEDECFYESCGEDNTCWIEHCDMNSRCREESCTKWVDQGEGEWSVADCMEQKDYSLFHDIFDTQVMPITGDFQDDIEMVINAYGMVKDSVNSGLKLICHENEDCFVPLFDSVGLHNVMADIPAEQVLAPGIDMFLANDASVDIANALVSDTQVILDGMNAPIDLDWMHTVLSAQDTYQVESMWQDLLSGHFWGVQETAEEEEEVEEEIVEEVTEEEVATDDAAEEETTDDATAEGETTEETTETTDDATADADDETTEEVSDETTA